MIRNRDAVLLVFGPILVWVVALWANWRGWIAIWALTLVGVVEILAIVLLLRRSRVANAADPLSPWRHYRIIRGFHLRADGLQDCCLTLELAHENDLAATAATLRFHGVMRLAVRQLGDHALYVDGLRCDDLGPDRCDGRRFRIRDAWREMIEFNCRSFEQVRSEPAGIAG
jgi:hypothetical protein